MITHQNIKKTKRGIQDIIKYLTHGHETSRYYSEEGQVKPQVFAFGAVQEHIENAEYHTHEQMLMDFSGRDRIGMDITLSMDKSISILSAFGDEDISQICREEIQNMVAEINDLIYTRDRTAGELKYVKADGLLSVYEHSTSRDMEPQMHFHILLSNQVITPDGKKSALISDAIVQNKYLLNVRSSYRVAKKLQEKGYRISFDKNGNVQLDLPEEILSNFSSRTKAIVQKAIEMYGTADLNSLTRDQLRSLKMSTRQDKQNIDIEDLRRLWIAELADMGYTPERLQDMVKTTPPTRELTHGDMERACKMVIQDMEEKHGIVKEQDLRIALYRAIQTIANEENAILPDLQQVDLFLQHKMQSEMVVYEAKTTFRGYQSDVPTRYVATQRYIRKEIATVQNASVMASTKWRKAFHKQSIEHEIAMYQNEKGFQLSDEQKRAVYAIATGPMCVMINGHAGAGKTTAIEVVSRLTQKKKMKVVGIAPTGKAAEELQKSLGSTAQAGTIDSFIANVIEASTNEKKRPHIDMIIVDEAGMVDVGNLSRVIEFAYMYGIKIVLQGDWKQIKPVGSGDIYTDIYHTFQEQYPHALAEMKTIRRQKKEEYKSITSALSEKEFREAYQQLLQKREEYISAYDENKIIEEYMKDPEKTITVTATNREKDRLNDRIREEMKKQGRIQSERAYTVSRSITPASIEDLQIGDEVRMRKDKKKYRISAIDERRGRIYVEYEHDGEVRTKEYTWSEFASQYTSVYTSVNRTQQMMIGIGDRIMTTKNDQNVGVKNGQIWTVAGIEGDVITLKSAFKQIQINTKEYAHFDYAYAITTHKSQGMTVSRVLIAAQKGSMDANLFYVGVTRGKEELKIFTDDEVSLLYTAQFENKKMTHRTLMKHTQEKNDTMTKDEIVEMAVMSGKTIEEREELMRRYRKHIDDLHLVSKIQANIDKFPEKKIYETPSLAEPEPEQQKEKKGPVYSAENEKFIHELIGEKKQEQENKPAKQEDAKKEKEDWLKGAKVIKVKKEKGLFDILQERKNYIYDKEHAKYMWKRRREDWIEARRGEREIMRSGERIYRRLQNDIAQAEYERERYGYVSDDLDDMDDIDMGR